MSNNNQCPFCDAYETFTHLLMNNVEMKEAFHLALEEFYEEMDLEGAFKEGYIQALTNSNRINSEMIRNIVEDCECDCDECGCHEENC